MKILFIFPKTNINEVEEKCDWCPNYLIDLEWRYIDGDKVCSDCADEYFDE